MEQNEVKKSVLVIKANAASLGTVEGFLRNRDWKIKSTTNLKEALIFLVQEQPAFVMISVDHPNKKVQKLPKILKQAFPVCVITFAEESSAASFKQLSASGAEYMIYPPVTGPAVERTANKYYKDMQNKGTATQRERMEGEEGSEDGVIAIRGSNQGFGGNAQNILAQLLNDDGANTNINSSNSSANFTGVASGTEENNNGSVTMAAGLHGPGTQTSALSSGHASTNSMSALSSGTGLPGQGAAYTPDQGSQDPNAAINGGLNSGPNSSLLDTDADLAAQLAAMTKGRAAGDMGMAGEGLGAGKSHSQEQEGHGAAASRSARQRGAGAGGGGWVPLPTNEKEKPRLTPEQIEKDERATKTDSVILRGTKEALEKACVKTSFKESEALTASTNVACIVIESDRFSGYLITAMAKDKVIDEAFIQKIHQRLFRFLRENGEKIADKEAMNINIKQVPFEEWALDYADFLRKSVHEGNEVAMAFFPRADIKTKTGDSVAEEMATIRVDELVGNAAVEFNVYVYLPRNNKFVLYTPRGGVFYNVQKDRLLGQGISQLHIFKSDLHDLEKYRAQNFLNDKIIEFEHRQRLKDAA